MTFLLDSDVYFWREKKAYKAQEADGFLHCEALLKDLYAVSTSGGTVRES